MSKKSRARGRRGYKHQPGEHQGAGRQHMEEELVCILRDRRASGNNQVTGGGERSHRASGGPMGNGRETKQKLKEAPGVYREAGFMSGLSHFQGLSPLPVIPALRRKHIQFGPWLFSFYLFFLLQTSFIGCNHLFLCSALVELRLKVLPCERKRGWTAFLSSQMTHTSWVC